ncbi:MAG TPA: hypothetical protein VGR47_10375 [Terracidiphilus sp.]|nr:hypothetical protein [Terracidiphilus sp.]
MFRTVGSRCPFVEVAFLLITPALLAQRPGTDCSKLVVNRTYVNSFEGFNNFPLAFQAIGIPVPPGVGIEPVGGGGTVTFLPGGKVAMKETIAIGLMGLNKDASMPGTYSLTWDASKDPIVCTGSITGTETVAGMSMPIHFQLIVSPDGQQVQMIHTDTGLMVGVTTQQISHNACSNFSIGATYSYNAMGWLLVGPGTVPPEQMVGGYIPFAMSGAMRFYPQTPASVSDFPESPSGAKLVKAWDTPSQGGQILPRTMTGWYLVNHDCTGMIVLRDSLGNPDFQLEMFIGAEGQTVYFTNVNDAVDLGNGVSTPPIILGVKLDRMDLVPWPGAMEHR